MKIYIPNEREVKIVKKNVLVLVRPFLKEKFWAPIEKNLINWKINPQNIILVKELKAADIFLIPMPINYYSEKNIMYIKNKYDKYPSKYNLKVFGFVSGDFGKDYLEYKNINFFRMNGFKSRFVENNIGFPATLSDQYQILFKKDNILINNKPKIPHISFCGHATNSKMVYLNQTFIFFRENYKRFLENPFRNDYEIFFQSAALRYKILKNLEQNESIKTNFIFREKYRAGASSTDSRRNTTLEYYENILSSDYVICIRGSGNFSIRLYETLMMGKIPIFIDTDCILPHMNIINWKDHVVWVDWDDVDNISKKILDFHSKISNNEFKNLQLKNRKLWLDKLNPSWTLNNLMLF